MIELTDETRRVQNKLVYKRDENVEIDNVENMPNLCNDIYGVMERIIAVGCCGTAKYKANDRGDKEWRARWRIGERYVAPRYMDFVEDGKYAHLYPVCKVYCANTLREFAYERALFDVGRMQEGWTYFEKTENGYKVMHGKMRKGDVEHEYANSVVCFMPSVGCGVVDEYAEFENENLAKAIVDQSARDIERECKWDVCRWKRDIAGKYIVKCIREMSKCDAKIGNVEYLFSQESVNELGDAIKCVKSGDDVAGGSMQNLYNSIYKVMDKFVATGCCGTGGYIKEKVTNRFANHSVEDGVCAHLYPACKEYCANALKEFSCKFSRRRASEGWIYCEKTESGYRVIRGRMYKGDVKPEHKDSVLCVMPYISYSIIEGWDGYEKEDLAMEIISQSAREVVQEYRIWDKMKLSQKETKTIRDIARYIKKKSGVMPKIREISSMFSNEAINEFYNAVTSMRSGNDIVKNDMQNLCNSIYEVMDQFVVAKGCSI